MICGECGCKDMEYKNQNGRASFPYKEHEAVLITEDLFLQECPQCGNLGVKGSECELIDDAIEKTLVKRIK
jgi:hypothetical protein